MTRVIDALAEAAGMTQEPVHEFRSKERLDQEAVAHAIATKGGSVPEVIALGDDVPEYLSAAHRDARREAATRSRRWSCEVALKAKARGSVLTAGVRGMMGLSWANGSGLQRQRDDKALATVASPCRGVVSPGL